MNSTDPDQQTLVTLKENLEIFILSCAPFTIIFNTMVIYISMSYINFNVRFEQFFVVSMTLSDLLFGLVYSTTIKFHTMIPPWLCRPYYAVVMTATIGSVMFLLMLNLHKLITLFFPLHAMIFMSKGKVVVQMLSCWIFIIFCSVIYVMEPVMIMKSGYSCAVIVDPRLYSSIVALFIVLPLTASFIISICIFGLVQKKAKKTTDTTKERKKLFKRILFVFVSTVWTAATCLPYRILIMKVQLCRAIYQDEWSYVQNVAPHHSPSNYSDTDSIISTTQSFINATSVATPPGNVCFPGITITAIYISQGLLTLGSVLNPVITIVTQSKYRKGLVHTWYSFVNFVCCRGGYEPPAKFSRNESTSCTRSKSISNNNLRKATEITIF